METKAKRKTYTKRRALGNIEVKTPKKVCGITYKTIQQCTQRIAYIQFSIRAKKTIKNSKTRKLNKELDLHNYLKVKRKSTIEKLAEEIQALTEELEEMRLVRAKYRQELKCKK